MGYLFPSFAHSFPDHLAAPSPPPHPPISIFKIISFAQLYLCHTKGDCGRVCLVKVSLADDHEYRLVRDLTRNYDPRIRPSRNSSEALNVTFGLALAQVIDVVRTTIPPSTSELQLYLQVFLINQPEY